VSSLMGTLPGLGAVSSSLAGSEDRPSRDSRLDEPAIVGAITPSSSVGPEEANATPIAPSSSDSSAPMSAPTPTSQPEQTSTAIVAPTVPDLSDSLTPLTSHTTSDPEPFFPTAPETTTPNTSITPAPTSAPVTPLPTTPTADAPTTPSTSNTGALPLAAGIRPMTQAPLASATSDPTGGFFGVQQMITTFSGGGSSGGGCQDDHSYDITDISVSPMPVYVNDQVNFIAEESGHVYGSDFEWTLTNQDTGDSSTFSTSTNGLTHSFGLAGSYTIEVVGTANTGCGDVLQASAMTQVNVQPVQLVGIEIDPNAVAQHGIVHYKAVTDPPDQDVPVTWEYKRTTEQNWIEFGDNQLEFDYCETGIGTWDVRATLNSGGVQTQQNGAVEVTPRPTDTMSWQYEGHWLNDPVDAYADLTLTVEHPAAGERTCKPEATIKLDIVQIPGTNDQQFSEIGNYEFSLAGHTNGLQWDYIYPDTPLTEINEDEYAVEWDVSNLSGDNALTFDIYAEYIGLTNWYDKNSETLLKLSGVLSWAQDDQGVYTSIGTTNMAKEQLLGLDPNTLTAQHTPQRNINRDQI